MSRKVFGMMLELALTVDRTDRVKARELFVVTEGNLEKTLAVLSDGICYVKKVKKKFFLCVFIKK